MEIKAQHKSARMAPRKIRQYREMLIGTPAAAASMQLKFMPGQAPALLLKVLRSAVANAKHNFEVEEDNLKISDIIIDGGFVMKRSKPASRGSVYPILKRTSHITIIMAETGVTSQKKKPKKKTAIQDFTAEDLASGRVGGPREDEEEEGHTHASHSHKPEAATLNKTIGGVDTKKEHRRKSIGE